MKNQQHAWQCLAAAARVHRDSRDESAPYGFANRIAAQACATCATSPWCLMERLALRGLIAACTLGLIATAYGFVNPGNDEAELAAGDVVGEILDLT